MNHAINRFSLDVHSEVSQIQLNVRRWETARSLYINLTENGMPYEIAEGCTAEIAIEKPDGSILKNNCQIIENEIRYDFTSRTTVSIGMLDCQIRLLDNSGNLLTSPRFSILVHSTIYDNGDAVEQEIVNANTVKSANPGYAEVFMWSDGNPTGEDRVGYFVTADMERSAAMVKKADAESEVCGVSMAAPGFASNAGSTRYNDQSNLISSYCYVGLMGFAPVIDNGTCTVNGRCTPGVDGSAVPDTTGSGYLVVDRVDDIHVLILLEASSSAKKYLQKNMPNLTGYATETYVGDTITNRTVNNFTTTEEGYMADARALKVLNDSKLSMELLWENGSPSSTFGENTINLDLTGVRYVIIEFTLATTLGYRSSALVLNNGVNNQLSIDNSLTGTVYRSCTVSDSGVNFGTGTNSSGNTDNNVCIPACIFGLKGASA